jgi:RHS repeat-associated protein
MLRLSWLVGIVRSKIGCPDNTRARRRLQIAGLLVAGLLSLPAVASAAECTDTWTGPAEGSWNTAEDWSLGTVPTSSDVVCIGPKTTVTSFEAGNKAGVLQVKGTLLISSGSVEVTNTSEASSVTTFKMTGGELRGAATVDVSGSMFEERGGMNGTGSTVIQSGASAAIGEAEGFLDLEGRTLVNEGTMTLEKGLVSESGGAVLINSSTLIANGESGGGGLGGGTGGSFINTGVLEKTAGTGNTEVSVYSENFGIINARTGSFRFAKGNATWASGSIVEGTIEVLGFGNSETVTGEGVEAQNATIILISAARLVVPASNKVKVGNIILKGGQLNGAGVVEIVDSLASYIGEMFGPGSTIIRHGATASIGLEGDGMELLEERKLINEGVVTFNRGQITLSEGSEIINLDAFKANSEEFPAEIRNGKGKPSSIQNFGLFEKNEGKGTTLIDPNTTSLGAVVSFSGILEFKNSVHMLTPAQFAERSPSAPWMPRSKCGDPVNCAIGNFYETQTDLAVGGRGVGLDLTRTYNSIAGAEGATGIFGHGWSSSFTDHVTAEEGGKVTVYHGNGSAIPFTEGKGETYTPPAWTQDSLSGSAKIGYSLVLATQVKYQFEGSTGRLQNVTDRNGNQTKLAYNKAGQLETITDPAGRKITLTYNGEGLVESAKDPMGHTVKYTYEGGTLKSVTLPGETKARWQYHYDESHQMTSMIDGRAGETVNEYNGSHQVTSQTDPAGHKLKFEYEAFHTKITNNVTGSLTDEWFNSNGEPTFITRGAGTANASTETLSYNTSGNLVSRTDGNEHTTEYAYDSQGNMLSKIDPNKNQTKWTYNQTHDVLTKTEPDGETTTVTRDAHGNAETVSRPAPGKSTQTTTYHYDGNGNLTSAVDPLKHTWTYEYNSQGDRTVTIDPEGDKRTFGFDEDSRETSMVSPAGNVKGAEASQYTTKTERDAQGRPTTVTDPLGHTNKYAYDGNGNLEKFTNGGGRTTTYTYNGDNQLTMVKAPNGATKETEYDGAGRVTVQIDGNKHTTTYVRNILGEVTEIKDPLGRVTSEEYDAAGNLIAVKDAAKRTTKYVYDSADRLIEIVYSDGTTPTVKYEYDGDGNRIAMSDGTGKSTYTFDILDRLVQSANGHGDSTGYEYDLAGEQTKLTYPGGNMLTRAYDSAGRLQSVTDWSKNTTTFAYDPNSNLTKTTFPKATGNQDKVSYNRVNQVMKITMTGSGLKVLASVAYSRDSNGQVKTTNTTGLPGTASIGYGYDANNRLTSAGASTYEYDAADNATKTGTSTNTYDAAGELETGTGVSYGYDQLGERTTTSPKGGQTTTYGYDQAGNLTQVKQGKLGGLNDLYTYNGDGLRSAQIKGKTATHFTWDMHRGLPLILSDEQNTYIYGPGGLPVEAIQSKGAVLYLHHDQQGSTRLLTGSTGAIEATATYDAYGNPAGTTGSVATPLGYDGQYTNADTGLIYLRTRVYDPATAQFMTIDPLMAFTRAPYIYGYDNPLNFVDPTGLLSIGDIIEGTGEALKGATEFAVEHPIVITAAGCTVGALAGPEVCAGAIAAGYGDSTVHNINDYYEGNLDPEQLISRQLGTAALSVAGTLPGLPIITTSAGGLVGDAPIPIQLLLNGYLEGPDTTFGLLEQQILCGAGIA